MIFDILTQEGAMKMFLKEQYKLGEMKGAVVVCQEFGLSTTETIDKLITKFKLTQDEASGYVRHFWKTE